MGVGDVIGVVLRGLCTSCFLEVWLVEESVALACERFAGGEALSEVSLVLGWQRS